MWNISSRKTKINEFYMMTIGCHANNIFLFTDFEIFVSRISLQRKCPYHMDHML